MGIKFIIVKSEELFKYKNINISKILNISKPNRPEVKEFFQKQLEALEKTGLRDKTGTRGKGQGQVLDLGFGFF
ncbi:MAG: hypothetical protein ACFWUA_06175 [Sporanaerobacter sp.]|jgi:oligoribonuclease (3'-5' exoribonuclease)|uniref:hypothetical protein n=1 Tax=Sporanaerobacter sp. TaxID=2010183 RepID=UPI003A0FF138